MVTTDQNIFYGFRKALADFAQSRQQKGDYAIVAVIPNELETKFTLLFSAPWIDSLFEDEFAAYEDFFPFLFDSLPNQNHKIQNIIITGTKDKIVTDLISLKESFKNNSEPNPLMLTHVRAGENLIDKIYLL